VVYESNASLLVVFRAPALPRYRVIVVCKKSLKDRKKEDIFKTLRIYRYVCGLMLLFAFKQKGLARICITLISRR
jgi:hypothetical protein